MPALSLPTTLLVFAAQCLVFSGAGVAAQVWRRRLTGRGSTPLEAVLLGALAPCALGYLAFALYFVHPLLGRLFGWIATAAVLGTLAHTWLVPSARAHRPAVHARLLALTALAGAFYISVLCVFPGPKFTDTARQRFLPNLPGDVEIPRLFAEHLYTGTSPKALGGDWLSSDRPPLQSGLALVTLPALRALDVGYDKACATAGVWFQLLWIPALWVFLRWLGLTEHQAHAATAALVFTGWLLFNSVFVWPKLAGGALVLLAFCTWFATESAIEPRHRWLVGGALAGFGSLAHGGVMFSLLALVPVVLFSFRSRWRQWLLAAAAFAVLSLPWFAYQRWYEPPGNRLLKWHLAGAVGPDARSLGEALADHYRAAGWTQAIAVRRENLEIMLHGEWRNLLATRDPEAVAGHRIEETFHFFRAPAAWILGVAALPLLAFQYFRRRPAWRDHVRRHGLALAWLGLTLALWLALMALKYGTLVHQGSYVAPLLVLGLLSAWSLLVSRWLFAALAFVQLFLFTLTWSPPTLLFTAAPAPFAIAAAGLSALFIATLALTALFPTARLSLPVFHFPTFPPSYFSTFSPFSVFAAFAVLLFLRKPYSLLVPQPYAEDGSIFLSQNDLLGLRAFLEPYMGYLHTLPRLIAWTASRLLDPAWWPAFYNVTAFALWLAVVVRTFSPRLPLPPALRPWLALAFFLGPQTGEVLFSITNLQWIVSFLLIEQAFLAPPATTAQRLGDLLLVVVLGLTGPFIIALGPLLAWRWWRAFRDPATTRPHLVGLGLELLAATACAAIQAWFIVRTGPKIPFPPFVASQFFEVVGQHLLVWPVVGDQLARQLPPALLGFAGVLPAVALLAWSLRPHPRRLLRAQLVAAFFLMLAAGIYRGRPDTWRLEDLVFGDRYFYLPRVLLAWILILEFDAVPRAVAWLARGLLLACALVHLKGYSLPAGPDYRWTEHVDPIRRGVPANLPTLPPGWTMEYRGRPAPR